jgi:hypothetical protein
MFKFNYTRLHTTRNTTRNTTSNTINNTNNTNNNVRLHSLLLRNNITLNRLNRLNRFSFFTFYNRLNFLRPPLQQNRIERHVCFSNNRKKIALLIGINYEDDAQLRLRGCINDTEIIKNILITRFNYKPTDIIILTDNTNVKPTKNNIRSTLNNIINRIRNENITEFFISFSGHGTNQYDRNSDENDNYDEALVPLDCKKNGIILDDELHEKYLRRLPKNVNVFALMDCCHSGTILDLQYKYKHNGGAFNNGSFIVDQRKTLSSKIIKISGCRDSQYSMDAFISGRFCGAMTSSFENTVNTSRDCRELLLNMRRYLKNNKFTQEPVLTSSFNYKKNDQILLK